MLREKQVPWSARRVVRGVVTAGLHVRVQPVRPAIAAGAVSETWTSIQKLPELLPVVGMFTAGSVPATLKTPCGCCTAPVWSRRPTRMSLNANSGPCVIPACTAACAERVGSAVPAPLVSSSRGSRGRRPSRVPRCTWSADRQLHRGGAAGCSSTAPRQRAGLTVAPVISVPVRRP